LKCSEIRSRLSGVRLRKNRAKHNGSRQVEIVNAEVVTVTAEEAEIVTGIVIAIAIAIRAEESPARLVTAVPIARARGQMPKSLLFAHSHSHSHRRKKGRHRMCSRMMGNRTVISSRW
jgi:mannose/fructose/N-acetylgalactosamine-specific phosphotransferase system component IIC